MLSKIFGHNKSSEKDSASLPTDSSAVSETIVYKPHLVAELAHENRLILAGIKLMLERIREGDSETVQKILVQLKKAVNEHYIKAMVSLYGYIKLHQADQMNNQIKICKDELSAVQGMLARLFNCYLNKKLASEDLLALGKELMVMTEVLMNRIRHEEQMLYPLYQPESKM